WRSFASVINKCLTGKSSGVDSFRLSQHKFYRDFITESTLTLHILSGKILCIRNNKAYKEYNACATGEAAPKPKTSARKKKGDSASSTTPPVTPLSVKKTLCHNLGVISKHS
nr:hypothetical protein [Tanacetum cinerariifolium]